ncbi:hypothetical protein TSUD_264570 [Trifolium subterraneum]|uniref:TIR domain-containing protein n=1 Tax=Trifolium subterraneum TaxID=3900 RepID=A0A2Z6MD04_TRISU|nr:hypothetical protein TSUD_264570 [Trifolium subterraneum]
MSTSQINNKFESIFTDQIKNYDVYLSFCDKDSGSFASHLYNALKSEAKLTVFWEDERTTYRLIVVPLFYDGIYPTPTDGTFRTSLYADSDFLYRMESTNEEDNFMTWVAANSKATAYAGSIDILYKYGNESEYIENVVEHVIHVLNKRVSVSAFYKRIVFSVFYKRDLFSAFYTESAASRAQDVIQLLKQSTRPLLIGIWGMTGIGKSTIAQAIYDQIGPYFEDKILFENIGGVWVNNKDQVSFEGKLFDICKPTEITIHRIELGNVVMQQILARKKVLLILDNVDKLEQLDALRGKQFGKGSKIIITTSDRGLFKGHIVDHIYRVKELDDSESLEVFNFDAFRQATCPGEDFGELSRQIVAYSRGLPLALKSLGKFLRGKEILEWKGALRSLERFSIPVPGLLQALEMSLSDLSNKEEQIFLDIACFFIGMNQNDALQTLNNRSTQCTTLQIGLLEDKSLVTIDENNKLQMHVLLQAMAKDIIKRESSNMTNQVSGSNTYMILRLARLEPKMYDVFLSFRGEDSRAKFISHLHSSLQNAGIHTFRDDDEIERGDQISTSLLQAIGRSRISIVVLSTNYANSRWCMLELEKIMEIGRVRGLVVVPVFYEVDPSEVRHQKGQFGEKFDDLLSKISVDEFTKSDWRRDLIDIGGIAGFVLVDSRNESADIKNIVVRVTRLLDRTELFVAEHPVGVESRVQAATRLLNIQKSEDVLLLGIWGMGGTGKTTIAKAIYNQIGSKFDGRSFLLNIREFWEKDSNLVSLQQQVLCDVYKTTTFKIRDIESGKSILKERLAQNKVLLVLDDVNELDQLMALCGSREWFGPGSRIIITTRDIHLLRSCTVDQVYAIQEMDESESLELFSWHAFKQPTPIEDFATQSTDVISYCGKLPLALEVLGSYLCDCELTEWQKVLEKLKCIPHDQVQKKLKVSFDGLKDVTEKQIFLDIACFFIGMDRNDAILILNGCGFFADIGIKVLVERSLVTVDSRNKLRMHDLLRDMGRHIIYEESPFDPENRSRLWRREEVFDILSNYKGTKAVKGLALEFPRYNIVCLNTKAFKKMNKLRLLRLARVQLNGDFKYLSRELRWLHWHGYPSTYAPAEFQQGTLVAITLKYSNLKQIWKKSLKLENLKILNLSHSRNLTETPDFSDMPNLEKLVLNDCPSLSKISHTIGSLDKILLINLTDCTGLLKLPRSIYKLKSLETLILSGCSNIDKLEEDVEQMESLITLIADKTAITKVPFSIVRSKSIGYISLCGFKGFSRDVFPSLILSWMSPSNNVISRVQTSVSLSSLGTFKDLRSLRVECGSELQLNQDVARILDILKATNSHKFEASTSATTSQISNLYVSPLIGDCLGLVHISRSKNCSKSLLIQMGTKCQVSNITEVGIFQTADGSSGSFMPPSNNKSDRFTFSCKGCSVTFDVPTMKGNNLKSMMLFVTYYSSADNITSECCQGVLVINYTKTTIHAYKRDTLTSFGHEDWQTITSNLEPGNKVEVMVVFGESFIVEKTTLSLLYDEEDVIVSSGGNIDMPADNNVTGPQQDENESQDKQGHAICRKRKREVTTRLGE